jgi:hypothetical protein
LLWLEPELEPEEDEYGLWLPVLPQLRSLSESLPLLLLLPEESLFLSELLP